MMTLAELKEATLAEIARVKAEENAVEQKKQIEEFDASVAELKTQLEEHLPIQLIKEYGVRYKVSTSSNALVMAVIDYRGAEICLLPSPASNWTHWDIDSKSIASEKGVASEDLAEALLVKFIDAIDLLVKPHEVEVKIVFQVNEISSEAAIKKAKLLLESITNSSVEVSGSENVESI